METEVSYRGVKFTVEMTKYFDGDTTYRRIKCENDPREYRDRSVPIDECTKEKIIGEGEVPEANSNIQLEFYRLLVDLGFSFSNESLSSQMSETIESVKETIDSRHNAAISGPDKAEFEHGIERSNVEKESSVEVEKLDTQTEESDPLSSESILQELE